METKKISFLQKLTEKILGKKFYIAVIAEKGSSNYFVNSTIYRSKQDVKAYKEHVKKDCPSLVYVCDYSFRSRFDFRLSIGTGKPLDVDGAKKMEEKECHEK